MGANFKFGNILIIVCSSEKKIKEKVTSILLHHINNSTIAFPWQRLSKKAIQSEAL